MPNERLIGKLMLTASKLPNDRVSELIEQATVLGGPNGPAWRAYLERTRKAGLPDQPQSPPDPKPLLLKLANERVEWVESSSDFDPDSYYKTRYGLYVENDFRANVVPKYGRATVGASVGRSFDLTRNAYDRKIEKDPQLGDNYIFTEPEVCSRIKQMTEKQLNGEQGDLLNNGYANLFYLAGCVVSVRWNDDGREWLVFSWERDGHAWCAGDRVFSRN